MSKVLYLLLFILFLYCSSGQASIKDLGVIGRTYPIVEKDALVEIEERARQIDWHKYLDKDRFKEAIKNYRPADLRALPRAKKDRVFTVDITYTLDFDIPDGKGGILYPKGYTFNPLDYMTFPNILVIINGEDKEQVRWFKRSEYAKDIKVMLLISDGFYWDIAEELKRPVFYATTPLLKRFNIQRVPSVVYQKGRLMEVKEFEVKEKNH